MMYPATPPMTASTRTDPLDQDSVCITERAGVSSPSP